MLAALAVDDPETSAALTDRMAADGDLPAALRSKLLLEDGLRWLASDTSRSERRFQEAQRAGKATAVQAEVRYQRARALISRGATLLELRMAADRLEEVAEEPGAYDAGAARLSSTARRVLVIGDSVVSGTADGDLRIFLAAEIARDSLGAGRLAASLFGRVAADWPDSPFAPKAILARIELDAAGADSLREALLTRYPESPYVAMAQGGDAPAYRVLEDSLRRFVAGFRPELRPPPPRRRNRDVPSRSSRSPPRQPADQLVRADLSRTVLGQRFQNPVLLAAGTAGFGREVAGVINLEQLGGLVTKAVSPEPRTGNRAPRVAEFSAGHAELRRAGQPRPDASP